MTRPVLWAYCPMQEQEDGSHTPLYYKGMFDGYYSLRWQNCYNDSGEFELHMPYSPENLKLFDVFDIVKIARPVKEQYGIVVNVETDTDERGFTNIAVRGRMLGWMLNFRFVLSTNVTGSPPFEADYTGKPQSIVRSILLDCTDGIATSGDKSRMLFGTTINVVDQTAREYEQVEYVSNCDKAVYDALQEIAKEHEIGFFATLDDTPQLSVGLYDYAETDIKFDLMGGSVSRMRVTKSIDNLVTDIGIESARGLVEATTEKTDIHRIDRYVNTDGVGDSSIPGNVQKLAYAKSKIALNQPVYAIDATIIPGGLRYLEDYTIGDIVRVHSALHGQTVQMPITSVTEVWEDFYSVQVQFGEQMQTGYGKLKNNLMRR